MHNGFLGFHVNKQLMCPTHIILTGLKMDKDQRESFPKPELGATQGLIKPTHSH